VSSGVVSRGAEPAHKSRLSTFVPGIARDGPDTILQPGCVWLCVSVSQVFRHKIGAHYHVRE